MRNYRSLCAGLGLVASVGLPGARPALAQFPISSGPPIVMTSPAVATVTPLVSPEVAPQLGSRGVTYATPLFSEARRKARTANKYTVARPVYAGRPGVTFAPYSDYYFPRVIGARETIYTGTPTAPAPVGYRAFARQSARPVFPR